MHPDNKLTNHGKTANSSAQPQHQNVSQGPACNLGSKGIGTGSHGGKANQISPGNSGLKSSQNVVVSLGPLKGKAKRERSVSVDSGEQRDGNTPSLDTESKEGVPRTKRRCVLKRKQPYSGDEWCSGPESEEEEEKSILNTHNCNVTDSVMSGAPQPAPGSNPLPSLSETSSSNVSLGTGTGTSTGLRPDNGPTGPSGKTPSHFVYVFTTHLANSAAEAVQQGRAESIVMYHQQNVPRAKLEQQPSHQPQKVSPLQEQLHMSTPSASTPQSQPPPQPPQSQQGGQPQQQQQQNPTQQGMQTPTALSQEGASEEVCPDITPNPMGNSSGSTPSRNNHNNTPNPANGQMQGGQVESSGSSGSNIMGDGTDPASVGNGQVNIGPRNLSNTEGLSKEQLEHRERSLQTLRDIERLLLRSGESELMMKSEQNANDGQQQPGLKKYEEPLQSMISQTRNLGGPTLEHENPHHPASEMGQQMSMIMQGMNQDNLTPEQLAWRKLQEEYYEEKRRKQEQVVIHQRTMQDMMLPQPIGGMMIRGPPPPYHSKPGEQWPPGMENRLGGPIDIQDAMQPRGGPPFSGPRFPTNQMQRVGGYVGMPNISMESMGPMNAMQRPVRPGMTWADDIPSMGGQGNFPQGTMPYPPGQGDPERFLNPRAREEILRHQLMEKRAMGRPMGMANPSTVGAINQGVEIERMIQAQRQMDSSMFPGENMAGNPMGMEFGGSRGMLSPSINQAGPMRDMDGPMGPGNLNMNMNVNMNMNMNLNVQMTPQQQMMMSQKMRGPEMLAHQGLTPEEIARVRAQNGGGNGLMGGPQKMMMTSQFPNQGQQSFPGGQGPYPNMPQEMGNPPDVFSTEQGPMPVVTMGITSRLSHMAMPPSSNPNANQGNMGGNVHPVVSRGLGRRPSDLSINVNPMNSPGMTHLKSPTLSQVHSPLVTSPSTNLKSPQTPSQLVSLSSSNQSGPLKSPQVLSSALSVRSPTSSPSRLKSPSMSVSSPGWTSSPKTALPSPGINQSKQAMSMNSSASMGGIEQGSLPPGSRNSSSVPLNNPGNVMNPNIPFTSSPDPTPSQNPLSLMMSQMSKYAMPSSTPLYHNAIKTIATSDDELLPDRPLLPSGNMTGVGGSSAALHLNSVGPASSHSPMGLNMAGGPPLSHDPPVSMMSSPNLMGPNIPMHSGGPGPGVAPQNPLLMPSGSQDSMGQPCVSVPTSGPQVGPQNHAGFPRLQQQQQQQQHHHTPMQSPAGGMSLTPGGGGGPGMSQHYPPGMPPPPEEMAVSQPGQMPPQQHILVKGVPHRTSEVYPSLLTGVASVLNDPDLSDVIRPTPTGIPEFDLSRIIPSEKPSSTLQYFPKSDAQVPKSQTSNLHLISLQNMMAEQSPPVRPNMSIPNLPGQQGVQRGLNMPMCHPGQMPMLGRTGMPVQQSMMGNMHQGMMSPQQMAQQNLLMLQAKHRSMSVSGEMYAQSGHMMSPQGPIMGLPPSQQSMIVSHQMRQRSMSLDGPISYGPGPGNVANMPF
ncbi:B-cell CLL/lymphoma 9-like protein isoform X1 [Latimeria chalumnae]|uniref:BCL9 like n=1 Tax=Latimeria chalumnae TaxID=7897 RepID=H3BCL0_LATCH|nr:PREDICTED: B-cell CLL/lymphoma 9-like protein isoform X1 [Latimeria chalumnae]XP_005988184.1 PREDICTED: B-cell CLL/lymphoma 9-like protein isoform X1 [Latimeria chalumnae]|eukprot:XP_005988183.1 PREDICTED: B-cell CLL/lymphoma 9-like protein isoform X1 [Latimeria chalumnae]